MEPTQQQLVQPVVFVLLVNIVLRVVQSVFAIQIVQVGVPFVPLIAIDVVERQSKNVVPVVGPIIEHVAMVVILQVIVLALAIKPAAIIVLVM